MRILKHIAFLLIIASSFSAVGNSTFEEAVEAFNGEKFDLSAQKFDSIVSISPHNIGAIYNLGLAQLENRQYGKAIWAFERVLKHQPNDRVTKDKIRECYFQLYPNYYWEFRLNGFQTILYSISPNAWGIIAIFSSIVLSFMLVLFRKNSSISMKRIALFVGFISFVFLLFSILTGSLTKQYRTQDNRAVVLKKTTSFKNSEEIREGQILECTECSGDTITFTTKNNQEIQLLKEDIGFI